MEVVTSPQHAKALLGIFSTYLQEYEKSVGENQIASTAAARHGTTETSFDSYRKAQLANQIWTLAVARLWMTIVCAICARVTRPFDSAQGRLLRFLHGRVAMLPALLCLFRFELFLDRRLCVSSSRFRFSTWEVKVPTLFSQRARKEGWGTRPGRPALVIRYTSGAEARVILMGLNGTSGTLRPSHRALAT